MLIAQITDLHAVADGHLAMGAVNTNAALEAAVARLNALEPPPDLVVVTGDLVDDGSVAGSRAAARRLSALAAPFVVLPGNHDDRAALRTAFPEHGYLPPGDGPLHYTIEDRPVRLVALDTTIPGDSAGALDEAALAWVDDTLSAAPERPTMLAMHHPPFPVGIDFMDRIGCAGGDAFAAVVARHPQVLRVICGHVHRPISLGFAGTVASIAPSTAHQIPLALDRPGSPPVPDAWVRDPAGFMLFAWTGRHLIGHQGYIGTDAGGPEAATPF
jgi:3',5'-cyclic AMP phosphodiesterase CpdA